MNRDTALALLLWFLGIAASSFLVASLRPQLETLTQKTAKLIAFSALSLLFWIFSTWIVLDFFGTEQNRTDE